MRTRHGVGFCPFAAALLLSACAGSRSPEATSAWPANRCTTDATVDGRERLRVRLVLDWVASNPTWSRLPAGLDPAVMGVPDALCALSDDALLVGLQGATLWLLPNTLNGGDAAQRLGIPDIGQYVHAVDADAGARVMVGGDDGVVAWGRALPRAAWVQRSLREDWAGSWRQLVWLQDDRVFYAWEGGPGSSALDIGVFDSRGTRLWELGFEEYLYPALGTDSDQILLPWSEGNPARLLSVRDGSIVDRLAAPPKDHSRWYGALDEGEGLAVMGSRDGTGRVVVWDLGAGATRTLEDRAGVSRGLVALKGGQFVLLWDWGLQLLDARTGGSTERWEASGEFQPGGTVPSQGMALSPSGRVLYLLDYGDGIWRADFN